MVLSWLNVLYYLGVWREMSNPMRTGNPGPASRPPAVAGHFYDVDPHRLEAEVGRLLASAPKPELPRRPKALIVPHAGYLYSGQVAATGFATVSRSTPPACLVLIGPAHYVPFRGIAAPTVDAFETPLGPVSLDRDALQAIAGLPAVTFSDAPHAPEHALEVEFPSCNGFCRALRPCRCWSARRGRRRSR